MLAPSIRGLTPPARRMDGRHSAIGCTASLSGGHSLSMPSSSIWRSCGLGDVELLGDVLDGLRHGHQAEVLRGHQGVKNLLLLLCGQAFGAWVTPG